MRPFRPTARTVLTALLVLVGCQGSEDPPSSDGEIARSPELESRIEELAQLSQGRAGIAVIHVESGRSVLVDADQPLPLQSVFKLPLAVEILREVAEGRLQLDQTVTVKAKDRAPGVASNQKKWETVPRDVSVEQLLEYSLVDSDNTSSDVLLERLGGPSALTRRMAALGFPGIQVNAETKAMGSERALPNVGTAEALAGLLASLQRGEALPPAQRDLLWTLMSRARTGERRIRGRLPEGTPVLDKTGTGRNGSATNDVGIVTLPDGRGHLAIAVLLAGSSRPGNEQEDLIAEVALAAFKGFAQESAAP
ncbi:MAG: class A beta-lactamase [Acidobacteriota bacterium]